jgi:hypothetical protein
VTSHITDPEQDLANRRPVWEALSELFLDTEVSPDVRAALASTLAQSPYSVAELRGILFDEVYPVCIANLLSVAGVWTRFDPDWLQERVLARRNPLLHWPSWLRPLRHDIQWRADALFAEVDAARHGHAAHRVNCGDH